MRKNRAVAIALVCIFSVICLSFLQVAAVSDTIEDSSPDRDTTDLKKPESVNLPILMYHHFSENADSDTIVTPETFESHIKILSDNGYTGIFFDQLVAYVEHGWDLPEKPVVITFDDGYSSNYDIAYPILQKYNMKATIFVIGVSVGKDTYRETGDAEYPIIPHFSYEQAREMVESGLVSIQSHSYDMHHFEEYEILMNNQYRCGILPLDGESEEDYADIFRNDYTRSKTELEAGTGTQSSAFSYPFGKYTELSEQLLSEMGVKVTVTTNSGECGYNEIVRGKPETLRLLNRYSVGNSISAEKLLEVIGENNPIERELDFTPMFIFQSKP